MKFNWKLVSIIILAAFLRFYQLGANPPSLDWDEVSLAYNAQALLETGQDEYGNSWPLTIRSFNDYKPPLYVYALIPSLAILGKSELAVRLPSAVAGTLTVLIVYFLVRQLVSSKLSGIKGKPLAELTALLLAISPWHTHFSRIAFEANLGLFFFVFAVFSLIKATTKPPWLALSALSFGLAMMAYHSTKLIIPIFLAFIFLPQLKTFIKHKKVLVVSGLITLLFTALIGRTIQQGVGQSRLNTVSFMTIDNLLDKTRARVEQANFSPIAKVLNHRFLVYGKEIIGGYLDHFSLNFWFIDGDSIPRSTMVSQMGLVYWWTLPFLFFGIVKLAQQKHRARQIIFTWFAVAPAASALTSGTPNGVRSIFFLPTFQFFTSLGILIFAKYLLKKGKKTVLTASAIILIIIASNVSLYFHNYYQHAPADTAAGWQYGYKEIIRWTMDQKNQYQRIIFTTAYDQPYIFLLWYGNYSPSGYTNSGNFSYQLENFEFREVNWHEDKNFKNTLIIATPSEVKGSADPEFSVVFPDGTPAFLAFDSEKI